MPQGIHAPDKGCVVGLDISVRSTGVVVVGRQPTIAKFSGERAESGAIKSTFGGAEDGILKSTFGGAESGIPKEEEDPANALRLAVTNETLSAEAGIRRRLEFKQYLKEALSGIPAAVVVVVVVEDGARLPFCGRVVFHSIVLSGKLIDVQMLHLWEQVEAPGIMINSSTASSSSIYPDMV